MSDIAFTYNKRRNRDGVFFDGVPLADITVAQFEALPAWVQAAVEDAPFYERPKAAEKPATETKTAGKTAVSAPTAGKATKSKEKNSK